MPGNLCVALRSGIVVAALLAGTTLSAGTVMETNIGTSGGIGFQTFSYVGLAFQVDSAVTVSELGVWASGLSAITADLSVYLFDPSLNVVVSQTFNSGSEGTLSDGYWFQNVTPVTLQPGTYRLVTYGWTDSEQEYNCYPANSCQAFNNGGGLLTVLGDQFGAGTDPAGTLGGFNGVGGFDSFAAENMVYDAAVSSSTPEPSSLLLLAGGLLAGFGARRRATR